jgi:hypothetical protein
MPFSTRAHLLAGQRSEEAGWERQEDVEEVVALPGDLFGWFQRGSVLLVLIKMMVMLAIGLVGWGVEAGTLLACFGQVSI